MPTDSYTKVNWENSPSTNTPINATNLGKMDTGIKNNNTGVRDLETAVGNITTTIGSTSISTIGDGSVTGAISQINTDLNEKISIQSGIINGGVGSVTFANAFKTPPTVFILPPNDRNDGTVQVMMDYFYIDTSTITTTGFSVLVFGSAKRQYVAFGVLA